MIIVDKSVLSYRVPEEVEHALEFEKEHPNWKRTDTTQFISFTHEDYWDVPLKKKENTNGEDNSEPNQV